MRVLQAGRGRDGDAASDEARARLQRCIGFMPVVIRRRSLAESGNWPRRRDLVVAIADRTIEREAAEIVAGVKREARRIYRAALAIALRKISAKDQCGHSPRRCRQ